MDRATHGRCSAGGAQAEAIDAADGRAGEGMMRRLPHGGTVRPVTSRPGNGYGRLPRRCPGPLLALEPAVVPEPAWFLDPPPVLDLTEPEILSAPEPRNDRA
jgi:hypothetical protein